MREVAFLKQNADKWKLFEALVRDSKQADPDRLADLFVEVIDDLAYAKTFYPDSKTARYLNELAADFHAAIYRNKKEERSRFISFWKREVPEAMREAHTELLLSFIIFALAVGIGTLSTMHDSSFTRLILGDRYVNMTLENIDQGDPMAVYKQMREFDMSVAIAINNVRVSFLAFAGGILYALGTVFLLFSNGVMLGTFHTLFQQAGLLGPALLVIYIHGTLEISAIVIAGAAGLTMGGGLLFPGTYTRGQAFRRGANRGVKIVIGLLPVFVLAALLEGYVTRHTDMPMVASLAIIFGSLSFILWYFVYYPKQLYRTLKTSA